MRCEWMHDAVTAEATYSAGDERTVLVSKAFNTLFKRLLALHQAMPLSSFVFTAGAAPGEWEYSYSTVDGREWHQHLFFDSDPMDPGQTFDVSDQFKVSEFANHRPLREHVVELHNEIGLTNFEATFS